MKAQAMSELSDAFNRSGFSRFINSRAGRVFRIVAGAVFLAAGYAFRHEGIGIVSMVWSILPLSAGVRDVCYISGALGGPLSGAKIREVQHVEHH